MNNKLFLLFPLLLIGSPALGQNIATALNNCSNEKNSLKRLVCFDRVVKDLNKYDAKELAASMPVAVKAPVVPAQMSVVEAKGAVKQVQSVPEAASQGEAEFGFEHKKVKEFDGDKLYAQVASIQKDPYDNLIVTLTNGQVWKQTETMYFKLKDNDAIYIERGVLSSFFLGMEDTNRRIRVKRIK